MNKKEKILYIQNPIEIARSFSYKMSLPGYENRDFFCSAKLEATESTKEIVSEKLFEFCKDEVMKSVYAYKLENTPIKELTPKEKLEAEQTKIEEITNNLTEEERQDKELEKESEVINELPNLLG